jgi:hypothetical protein
MVDRNGKEVTTAVTNLDIHDIARSCKTFGVQKYFVVNPEEEQRRIVSAILNHWNGELSLSYHPARAKALERVQFAATFEEAYNDAAFESGAQPFVVMPDARDLKAYFGENPSAPESSPERPWTYAELRERLSSGLPGDSPAESRVLRPLMIVFGTGWGIAPSFFGKVDRALVPIRADREENRKYNHLSVRAAAAIVLDRVFGERV